MGPRRCWSGAEACIPNWSSAKLPAWENRRHNARVAAQSSPRDLTCRVLTWVAKAALRKPDEVWARTKELRGLEPCALLLQDCAHLFQPMSATDGFEGGTK